MPFREKAKLLFKSKSKTDGGSSLSRTSTENSSRERWPSNVYKPGETMPRPKYRATPKKEHTERLQAFSFAEAWRKKSFQSQHSPMGTRAPSRRNSFKMSSRRNSLFSLGRRSGSDAGRTGSVHSTELGPGGTKKKGQKETMNAAKATTLSTEPEEEGDDDVRNVGLSRVNSHQRRRSRERTIERQANGIPNGRPMSTAHDHQPFTEQELALALSRSHLAVPAR